MMDRRTQRVVLVVLFFLVTIILYRTLGSGDTVLRYGGRRGRVTPEGTTALRVDPKGLAPANSTLGVCIPTLYID